MHRPQLTIHLVLDNGSSHAPKATWARLAAHPRFAVHHTPKHASWLKEVEIFFSIPTHRLLRRGGFTSRRDLIDQIREFARAYEMTPDRSAGPVTEHRSKRHDPLKIYRTPGSG